MQMEDEIASICATIGAAFGGALACTASSGPGISLMQEGIGYAAETEAPIVVVNVMRGGPSTGMPTRRPGSRTSSKRGRDLTATTRSSP